MPHSDTSPQQSPSLQKERGLLQSVVPVSMLCVTVVLSIYLVYLFVYVCDSLCVRVCACACTCAWACACACACAWACAWAWACACSCACACACARARVRMRMRVCFHDILYQTHWRYVLTLLFLFVKGWITAEVNAYGDRMRVALRASQMNKGYCHICHIPKAAVVGCPKTSNKMHAYEYDICTTHTRPHTRARTRTFY